MFCFVCPIFRWGFYIHGAIDGFSRLIPFLCVVIGNTAKLALTCFIKGIRRRGLPSRIRLDHPWLDRGSEYNDCARFMEWHRGPGRGSAMRGRSVHNQRIERLWRDVFTKVLESFYKLFYHLEDRNVLDINNPMHIFVLQYTYLPRIQAALNNWAHVHNNHGIRTEQHKTPEQLWFSNIIKQRCSVQSQRPTQRPSVAVSDVLNFDADTYAAQIMNRFDVQLSETRSEVGGVPLDDYLSAQDLHELRRQIDPLRASDVRGIDIYSEVVFFLLDCTERASRDSEEQQDDENSP